MKFSFRQQYFANSSPSFSLLPHVLALAMTHILLTLVYEETALISAMLVWALLIKCIDADVDVLFGTLNKIRNRPRQVCAP